MELIGQAGSLRARAFMPRRETKNFTFSILQVMIDLLL